MREIRETDGCARAEQLIGYLYGEATADECAVFERHLTACAACRDELAAFGQVRAEVGAWRAEVWRNAPALSAVPINSAPTDARTGAGVDATPRRRSARAALGEFFALAPAWLRVSSVAAALLFCALAALTVFNAATRGGDRPTNLADAGGPDSAPRRAQSPATTDERAALLSRLGELEAERDAARRELEETRAQLDDSRASNIEAAIFEEEAAAERPAAGESPRPARPAPAPRRNPRTRRGASGPRDEDELPRLLDLLNDAN